MKPSSKVRNAFLAVVIGILGTQPLAAIEVVTEEDLIQGVVVKEQLVRVADNAIFMIDTSSSMSREYLETGKSTLEIVTNEFKKRNAYFPDIGHQFGLYVYTGWKEIYATQPFDREKVAAALDTIPVKGSGPTLLAKGLRKVEDVIEPLSGRTALFVFTDGVYTGEVPSTVAKRLAKNHDVCFYVISTATELRNERMLKTIADLNACSRLIPFESFLSRPEYTTGALFDVVATAEVVTIAETRIAGLKVDNINFEFDESELTDKDKAELDELGEFMASKPDSYALIAGYTDNAGAEDYNERLARRRTEMVANYLTENHRVDETRLVLHWFGSDNPLASNDTPEGRAMNRRVEVAVGGI
jgi:OOP family OmpA-OmpF porin